MKIRVTMAIKIAINDQNGIFRESRKTLLEQIEGFRMDFDSAYFNGSKKPLENPVELWQEEI
jgi:hypothetical protein